MCLVDCLQLLEACQNERMRWWMKDKIIGGCIILLIEKLVFIQFWVQIILSIDTKSSILHSINAMEISNLIAFIALFQ